MVRLPKHEEYTLTFRCLILHQAQDEVFESPVQKVMSPREDRYLEC